MMNDRTSLSSSSSNGNGHQCQTITSVACKPFLATIAHNDDSTASHAHGTGHQRSSISMIMIVMMMVVLAILVCVTYMNNGYAPLSGTIATGITTPYPSNIGNNVVSTPTSLLSSSHPARIQRRLLQSSSIPIAAAPTPTPAAAAAAGLVTATIAVSSLSAAASSAAVDGALDRLSNELTDLKFAFSDDKLERLLRDLADFQQQLESNPATATATVSATSTNMTNSSPSLEDWLATNPITNGSNTNGSKSMSGTDAITTTTTTMMDISITIRIMVNEHFQLERCLASLLAATYPSGSVVHLELWIDHSIGRNISDPSLAARTQQQVIDARLYGHSLIWPHGSKRIHSHVGSEARDWPHTWRPKAGARHDYSYFLSSDAEVSPLFYTTLLSVISQYRLDASNMDPNMFGVCLEPYPIVLARDGIPMMTQLQSSGDSNTPFLYMLPCEGNQLVFPEHWADFLAWFSTNSVNGKNPYLGNLGIPEQWYDSNGRALWMAWLVRYLYVRNSYTLHMNMPMDRSLSISHSSVLATSALTTSLTSSSLIRKSSDVAAERWQLPALSSLPRYDLCMTKAPRGVIARDEASFKQLLADRVVDNVIIMVTVNKAYRDFLYNWLCTIKRLHITNYVLYTVDHFMARELAAEGHPVYFNSVLLGRDITSNATLDYGTVKYQMLILARTHFIGRVLSMGITVLVADVDAVWMENPLPYLHGAIGDNNFLAQDDSPPPTGKGVICGGFMYLMPTQAMIKLWTRVTTMHEDIVRNGLNIGKLKNVDESEQAAMTRLIRADKSFKFAYLEASKFPNGYEYFKSKKGELLEAMVIHNNFVIGAEPKRLRFREADLWFIDDIDTHCKAITC